MYNTLVDVTAQIYMAVRNSDKLSLLGMFLSPTHQLIRSCGLYQLRKIITDRGHVL